MKLIRTSIIGLLTCVVATGLHSCDETPDDPYYPDYPDYPWTPDYPDYPDDPDDPSEPENPGDTEKTAVQTLSAEPRAFSATIYGEYSGNKKPTEIGFEYSYDSSFRSGQTGGYTVEGKYGGVEFEATGLVDLTKVYYRVYAVVDNQRINGETKSFQTRQGTYTIDGKTYNFIKVTGLGTGSFSMMQTELPPSAEILIDGKSIGCWDNVTSNKVTAAETREFLNRFAKVAVVPRYPTPQEWLYAASGGALSKGYTYSGSNDIDAVAWYSLNSNNHVRKPAQKLPNELGFYDMSGNYAELCSSYDEDQLEDIREKYIKRFVTSIAEVSAQYFSVSWQAKGGAFGGSWNSPASACKKNSSVAYDTPAKTNQFDGETYTVRLVYSRPD